MRRAQRAGMPALTDARQEPRDHVLDERGRVIPGGVAAEEFQQVGPAGDQEVDHAGDAEPGHDLVVALGVHLRLGQQDPLAPLLVVEGGLEQSGGLARVHRPVAEVEFGHGGRV